MEQKQEANRKRLQDLSLLIRRTESQESDVQTFIHEIRQYAAIQELDEAMLHRLISRIVVGEMKKVDGQKQQEVKIIYNFVGEIPEEAPQNHNKAARLKGIRLSFRRAYYICLIFFSLSIPHKLLRVSS